VRVGLGFTSGGRWLNLFLMFGTLDLFSCFHIYRPHKLGDIYCPLLS